MPRTPWSMLVWGAVAATLGGCDALTQFRTNKGQIFNGEVIGSDSDSKKNEASFIREGFVSHTQMDLTFDPFEASHAVKAAEDGTVKPLSPGTIETYVCSDNTASCPSNRRELGDFKATKLEQFVRLNQDALSQYDFPGGGRLRNYILGARFASGLEDGSDVQRNAMVFLSLMENGKIEVRVVSPSVLDQDQTTELLPALFGVFVLEKHAQR